MLNEQIKEIQDKINELQAQLNELQIQQRKNGLNLEWVKPDTYIEYDFMPDITGYMKVLKLEKGEGEEGVRIYGKRVIIKHRDVSTQVSFNSYDNFHIEVFDERSDKIKEISEGKWNEIYTKAKDFVLSFD